MTSDELHEARTKATDANELQTVCKQAINECARLEERVKDLEQGRGLCSKPELASGCTRKEPGFTCDFYLERLQDLVTHLNEIAGAPVDPQFDGDKCVAAVAKACGVVLDSTGTVSRRSTVSQARADRGIW